MYVSYERGVKRYLLTRFLGPVTAGCDVTPALGFDSQGFTGGSCIKKKPILFRVKSNSQLKHPRNISVLITKRICMQSFLAINERLNPSDS